MLKSFKKTELKDLQAKYPAALYSFFRVYQQQSTYEKFTANTAKPPHFAYHHDLTTRDVEKKAEAISADIKKHKQSKSIAKFLRWRRREYEVLRQFCNFRHKKRLSPEKKREYMEAQLKLYGEYDAQLFRDVFLFLINKAKDNNKKVPSQKLVDSIDLRPGRQTLPTPKKYTFLYYRRTFCDVMPELCEMLGNIPEKKEYTSKEIRDYFKAAIEAVGAGNDGWRVIRVHSGGNVVVSKFKKKILLPHSLRPKSVLRLRQMIAHEVGGHVQRSLYKSKDNYIGYDDEEEGIAILLEQLVDDHFVHKRAMRYFAIGLACGVDGRERNFSEVYKILVLAYEVLGYGHDFSKKSAFSETVRVFRGGLPSQRGVAYIKDKIYLEGNLKVWKKLRENKLSQEDFRQLLRGHDTMLLET